MLTKYCGDGGDIVIPAGVTSIGHNAFRGCAGLNHIKIPISVTSVGRSVITGNHAFAAVGFVIGEISYIDPDTMRAFSKFYSK